MFSEREVADCAIIVERRQLNGSSCGMRRHYCVVCASGCGMRSLCCESRALCGVGLAARTSAVYFERMLHLNLIPLLKARGVSQPYAWLVKSGFPVSAARRFAANDYKEIPLRYLEKLCLMLRCTPNDLLCWEPEGEVPERHPLAALISSEASGLEWIDELRGMSLDELRALGRKLKPGSN